MSLADWRQRRDERAKARDAKPVQLPVVGGPRDGGRWPQDAKKRPPKTVADALEPEERDKAVAFWSTQRGSYERVGGRWLWVTPTGGTDPAGETVAKLRLPRHPKPKVMVGTLRDFATQLGREGEQAILRASVYATRGLKATHSDGARANGNEETVTERAAGLAGDDEHSHGVTLTPPDPRLIGVDHRLADALHRIWKGVLDAQSELALIQAHASDEDPLPAGTGPCRRCDTFCRPTAKRPNFRIMSGYCPTCHRAWHRAGRPDKTQFDRSYSTEAA